MVGLFLSVVRPSSSVPSILIQMSIEDARIILLDANDITKESSTVWWGRKLDGTWIMHLVLRSFGEGQALSEPCW